MKIKMLLCHFLDDTTIVSSWGLTNIKISEDQVSFDVDAFNFKGTIRIIPEGIRNYTIYVGDQNFTQIPLNQVTELIDRLIESGENYEDCIIEWLKINKVNS